MTTEGFGTASQTAPRGMQARLRSGAVWKLAVLVRTHARAALLAFLLVLITGLMVGFALPRPFVATAYLWLDRGRGDDAGASPNTSSARLARNTELRLLTSQELAARTVAALGLERIRGLGQPRDGSVRDEPEARAEATRMLRQRLSVEPVDDTYAARIRFRADRPEIAASVANRLADLYVDDRRGASAGARERQRLAAAVAQTREAVVRSEAAIRGYRSAAAVLGRDDPDADPRRDVTALDVDIRTAIADAQLARAREARANATAAPILRDLERRRTQRATEDNIRSDAIDGQISKQRRTLERFQSQVRLADAQVRLLSRMRERSARTAAEAERIGAELARLERAAAAARTSQAQALSAFDRAKRAEPRSTAYVISRSSADGAVRTPGSWTIALASLGGAAAAALLVAFALDRRHKGFMTAAAVEHALGTKVLAMVPELSELRRAGAPEDRLAVPDHLVQEPGSRFAEAFRTLLAALQAHGARPGPLVIALSSALPDEGKTTVALCLARSAALGGHRTVLVDCDVRRPAASRTLFPTLPVGLVEVIEGEAEPAAALRRDPGSDAMILGIGSNRPARTVSLDPKRLQPVIERLRQDFDFIICDCPPALALSEAREAAALADMVLLVIRQRVTPKGAVTIAQDLLTRASARIAGTVLTMVRT